MSMLKCIDAIHLTIEAARRTEVPGNLIAETLDVWDSAFRAADTLAGFDELEGAGADQVPPVVGVSMLHNDFRRVDEDVAIVEDRDKDSELRLFEIEDDGVVVGSGNGLDGEVQKDGSLERRLVKAAADTQETVEVVDDVGGRERPPVHGRLVVP